MKKVEAQGYSKVKAFETTGLEVELEMLKNATQAWKKAGSPTGDKAMNTFMANYIKDKKAIGAYLVLEAAADDTRLRPYTVINEVTHGKRKTTTFYQIVEAEIKATEKTSTDDEGKEVVTYDVKVLSEGAVAGKAERKDAAFKLMKELIEANKTNYSVKIVKEVTEGQAYAGYGLYTPSKSAKKGKFIFFQGE